MPGDGGGGLCKGETHVKPKVLRGREGRTGDSERRLHCPGRGQRSSCINRCDVVILRTCQKRRFLAKRERFLYFSGRRERPSSIRFHSHFICTPRPPPYALPSEPSSEQHSRKGREGESARAGFQTSPNFPEAGPSLTQSGRPSRPPSSAPPLCSTIYGPQTGA